MRVGNVQFAKGSIVYADFPHNSEQAYLNGRPLLVVSHPIYIFGQVVVCPIGSKMKPGIQVRLWNYKESRPIGNYEIGTIYPYNLISIRTELIRCQIGVLDHFIMEEVDSAIKFFLGFSNNPPEFMKSMEEAYEVNYTFMTKAFTCDQRVGSDYVKQFSVYFQKPVQIESENTSESDYPTPVTVPATPVVTETPVNEPIKQTEAPQQIVKNTRSSENQFCIGQFVKKYMRLNPKATTIKDLILARYNEVYEKSGWRHMEPNGFGKSFSKYISTNYPDSVIIRRTSSRSILGFEGIELIPDNSVVETVEESEPVKTETKEIKLPDNVDEVVRTFANSRTRINPNNILPYNHDNVVKYVSLKSMAMIISRRVPIEAVALKYSLTIDQSLELRSSILKYVFNEVNHFLTTERNINKFAKYNYIYKLGLAILLEFGEYVPNSPKVRVQLNQMTFAVRSEYKVNFTDPIWDDLRNKK